MLKKIRLQKRSYTLLLVSANLIGAIACNKQDFMAPAPYEFDQADVFNRVPNETLDFNPQKCIDTEKFITTQQEFDDFLEKSYDDLQELTIGNQNQASDIIFNDEKLEELFENLQQPLIRLHLYNLKEVTSFPILEEETGLQTIQQLRIENCSKLDLTSLAKWGVENLELKVEQQDELDIFTEFNNLETLSLTGNFKELKILSNLPQLKYLTIDSGQLISMTLGELPSLEEHKESNDFLSISTETLNSLETIRLDQSENLFETFKKYKKQLFPDNKWDFIANEKKIIKRIPKTFQDIGNEEKGALVYHKIYNYVGEPRLSRLNKFANECSSSIDAFEVKLNKKQIKEYLEEKSGPPQGLKISILKIENKEDEDEAEEGDEQINEIHEEELHNVFKKLTQECRMEELTILGLTNLPELKKLPTNIELLKNLKNLRLKDCPSFDLTSLSKAELKELELESLTIEDDYKESLEPHLKLPIELSYLEKIKLVGDFETLKIPPEFKQLKSIYIESVFLNDLDIPLLPFLKELSLDHCINIDELKKLDSQILGQLISIEITQGHKIFINQLREKLKTIWPVGNNIKEEKYRYRDRDEGKVIFINEVLMEKS